jgi:hypothetical protein
MRFQHLLGGLREARFVAVNRRYLEKTREKSQQRECHEQCRRAAMRAHGIVQRGGERTRRSN